jgi:hypothetical protein
LPILSGDDAQDLSFDSLRNEVKGMAIEALVEAILPESLATVKSDCGYLHL